MKRTVFALLALLMMSTTAFAQNKAQRIKDIREAYAQAKKDMADNGKGEFPTSSIPTAISSWRNGVLTDIRVTVRCSSTRSPTV